MSKHYESLAGRLLNANYINEEEANLLAAAPQLLEACKLALSACDPHSEITRRIVSAITLAEEGETENLDE